MALARSKFLSIPGRRSVLGKNREMGVGYLNTMERLTGMGYQKTPPAELGLGKTVDATIYGVRFRTGDAHRLTRQQRRGLQPGVLVQEFIFTLKPLFQQRLFIGLGLWWRGNGNGAALTLTDRLSPFRTFFFFLPSPGFLRQCQNRTGYLQDRLCYREEFEE